MNKATFLSATLGLTMMALALQAKQPEKRDTTQVQKSIVKLNNELKEGYEGPDEEIALIDAAGVGIGGDEAIDIPANDLYAIWNNAMSNPYQIAVDSIITKGDTLAISLEGYSFPLPVHYRVNSEFGKRGKRFHYGIDLKVNTGDTVVSSMGGMVRVAKYSGAYGNLVVVRHHNGLETYYGHLSKLLVKPDQMVESGEIIGLGGNTGRSTGPHLHYEVRYLGKAINPRHVIDVDSALAVKSDTLLLTAEHFNYLGRSVPAKTSAGTTTTASGTGKVWVVKNGETLSLIAQRTATSISYLCNVNGISRNKILRLGQKIKY